MFGTLRDIAMQTAYHNGNIFTGIEFVENKAVLVNDGIIAGLVDEHDIPSKYTKADLHGLNLAPSFIDLQIYGGNGKMFSHELSVASLQATYEYSLNGGASHFMITMATNSIEKFLRGMEIVRAYWQEGGKGLLGCTWKAHT